MIRIVTALVRDEQGRVLLVRKHGTDSFLQPGGKREPGEDDLACLGRELEEEIGCSLVPGSARHLGTFEAPAANEPGRTIQAEAYAVGISGTIRCRAEIAEFAWVDPERPGDRTLAPLTRDVILPLAASLKASQAL